MMGIEGKEQFECFCKINRPLIIFGCAGSGKTMIAIRKLILNNELNKRTAYITCSNMIRKKQGICILNFLTMLKIYASIH
jgi:predicted ATPase with chaperone activity